MADLGDRSDAWKEQPLSSLLASMESGSRPKGGVRGINDGVPSLGGEHLDALGGFKFDNVKYVPRSFYASMRRGHIRAGDVLVVKDGATTGKVSFVRDDFPHEQAVANEHLFVCRPGEVDPEYLFWYLYSDEGQRRILEHFKGSAQGGITRDFADGTLVPVAPPAVQEQLVRVLRAAFDQRLSAGTHLSAASRAIGRLRDAVIAAAYSGRLTQEWRASHEDTAERVTEFLDSVSRARARVARKQPLTPFVDAGFPEIPEGWQWASADELTSLITKGTTPPSSEMHQGNGEIPYIKVYNLTFDGVVDFSVNPTFVRRSIHDGLLKRSRVFPGDLLLNIVGPPLGKVGVVPHSHAEWNINQAIAVFRPVSGVNPEFLKLWLLSPQLLSHFARRAKATAGQYNLTLEICREVPVPIPSPEEQDEIVRMGNYLLQLADGLALRVDMAAHRVDRSSQAVLAKAFRGELLSGGTATEAPEKA